MYTTRLALIAVLIAFAVGCDSNSNPNNPSPTPNPSGPTVTIVSGASVQTSTAYSPNPITVAPGSTVVWVNNDNTTHTSTANDGSWDSGGVAPGGSFSRAFPNAGTFAYRCTIHPNMIGTVTVQ